MVIIIWKLYRLGHNYFETVQGRSYLFGNYRVGHNYLETFQGFGLYRVGHNYFERIQDKT